MRRMGGIRKRAQIPAGIALSSQGAPVRLPWMTPASWVHQTVGILHATESWQNGEILEIAGAKLSNNREGPPLTPRIAPPKE